MSSRYAASPCAGATPSTGDAAGAGLAHGLPRCTSPQAGGRTCGCACGRCPRCRQRHPLLVRIVIRSQPPVKGGERKDAVHRFAFANASPLDRHLAADGIAASRECLFMAYEAGASHVQGSASSCASETTGASCQCRQSGSRPNTAGYGCTGCRLRDQRLLLRPMSRSAGWRKNQSIQLRAALPLARNHVTAKFGIKLPDHRKLHRYP